MKPSELLHEVRRRLLSGPGTWAKGSGSYYGRSDGRKCVLGWFRQLECERGTESLAVEGAAYAAMRPHIGILDLIAFNDAPERKFWDVIAVLGKAQRDLEARGE